LNAGGTVRNYGFLVNNNGSIGTKAAPVSDPFAAGIVQVALLDPALASLTDVYFRGYDQNYPDLWRYNEWKREFDQYVANGNLPNLSLVRISHDHMGSFGTALGGVNTPETQQADCDLALGLLVQAVANSRYAADTLIIVTEDDVQDGVKSLRRHQLPGTDTADVPGLDGLDLVRPRLAGIAERLMKGVAHHDLARSGELQEASGHVDTVADRSDVHAAEGTQ
jgi:hypothetical protein